MACMIGESILPDGKPGPITAQDDLTKNRGQMHLRIKFHS